MAIAVSQSPTDTSSAVAGTTIAKAYTAVAAGTFLVCIVQWQSITATCSVSDTVNGSWTPVGTAQHGATYSSQVFYFLSSASGTPTVTATISASVNYRAIVLEALTGVASIEGTPSVNNSNATSATAPAVTPAIASDAILAFCAPADTVLSVASPMTLFTNSPGSDGIGAAYDLAAGTGTVTPTFTKNGSGDYQAMSMVLVASAGATRVPTLTMMGVG